MKKKSNHAGELHVSIKKRRKPTNDDTQTGSITTPDQDRKKKQRALQTELHYWAGKIKRPY
jgi:hypothetical protein